MKSNANAREVKGRLVRQGLLELAERIASREGVNLDEMLGPRRTAPLVRARNLFLAVVRERGDHWGWSALAKLMGRDHSTIRYGVQGVPRGRIRSAMAEGAKGA